MSKVNDLKSIVEKILRKKESKLSDKNMNELSEVFNNLNPEDKKRLMDSGPEEVAKKWEELYELPIQQSKYLLNDLFFRRSGQNNGDSKH
ncbi:hypothetical protein [Sporolactobacillus shoreae]|nr:hypothetical protein [Sporolactobacillus shoreae]